MVTAFIYATQQGWGSRLSNNNSEKQDGSNVFIFIGTRGCGLLAVAIERVHSVDLGVSICSLKLWLKTNVLPVLFTLGRFAARHGHGLTTCI